MVVGRHVEPDGGKDWVRQKFPSGVCCKSQVTMMMRDIRLVASCCSLVEMESRSTNKQYEQDICFRKPITEVCRQELPLSMTAADWVYVTSNRNLRAAGGDDEEGVLLNSEKERERRRRSPSRVVVTRCSSLPHTHPLTTVLLSLITA
jgi:hypothetical protein